jgi:hypothetical protein
MILVRKYGETYEIKAVDDPLLVMRRKRYKLSEIPVCVKRYMDIVDILDLNVSVYAGTKISERIWLINESLIRACATTTLKPD